MKYFLHQDEQNYPFISVIIPAYNAEMYLSDALNSLMDQKYPHLEILVIDDGSTDRTRSIAESHPAQCTYFYQSHHGVSEARNYGIHKACGTYISFLDADDVYLPNKLLSQSAYLNQNPQADIILCPIQLADEKLLQLLDIPFICFSFGAALIRKEVFDRVGHCNPSLAQSEDIDWFLRSRDSGIVMAYQTPLGMLYRQHASNMTRDRSLNRHCFLRALHQSVLRRINEDKQTSK